MKEWDELLAALTARLDALIADQERLFEVVRKEKIELIRMERLLPISPRLQRPIGR